MRDFSDFSDAMTERITNGYPLSILPLGGVREIGKNCFVVEYGDEMIVVDAGVNFPSDDMFGVDVIIPNFEYLLERSERLKGIIITHGHEDHIGALPYFLRSIHSEIYTTDLTAGLIRNKLTEDEAKKNASFHIIKAGDDFHLGDCFDISTVQLNHSIPAGLGLRIKTPGGTIVISGDFKLDQTPMNNEYTDIRRFAKWGEEGVDIFVLDVTNVFKRGFTPSERRIGVTFEYIFERTHGRIFIALFSSHFHRLQQAIDVANGFSRRIAILGRSMIEGVATARELGYLNVPDGMLIDSEEIDSCRDNEILVFATGSQGEPLSALTRMASSEHTVSIRDGDTVIISANPIPGNEASVGRVINRLSELGARVIDSKIEEVHVSGHGAREEIKILYNIVQPRYIMPFHGETRQFREFHEMMLKMGHESSHVLLTEIGDRVQLQGDEIAIQKAVTGGERLVRGDVVENRWTKLANERWKLATGGVLIATIHYNRRKHDVAKIELISRGLVAGENWDYLFERAQTSLIDSLRTVEETDYVNFANLKERAEQKLSRIILRHTGLRPLIIVNVYEV